MVFDPSILALQSASVLISFMIVYSSFYGVQILKRWDIQSGSEGQLIFERKTYLISTFLSYVFGFELLSLFLFIFTADRLHPLLVGAMCAAGTLKANLFGYPALLLKISIFLLSGLWLILNFVDHRAYDYPLIKKKYLFLLLLAPLILAEMIFQAGYFLNLRPNIITSCCGSLFSAGGETGLASEIAALPIGPMKVVFFSMMGTAIFAGFYYSLKNKGGWFLATASGIAFPVSLASIISFISPYFYELPTHHCPFCLLQKEYGYVGYPLYAALLGSTITGMGVGVLMPFRKIKSLAKILPPFQKKLALASAILLLFFTAIVTLRMIFTPFILEG